MEIDILGIGYVLVQNLIHFFSNSYLIAVVKFFLFIYVVVLFIDIALLLVLRGVSADVKKTLYGTQRPLLRKSTIISRFEKILDRLKSDNPSQYKVAVLEMDTFVDEILSESGYKGATMTEKLENIHEGQLESRNFLMEAHQTRNRIVHEADFALTREDAEKCIAAYRAFFIELELF